MNELQNAKFVAALAPAAIVDNNSVTPTVIDATGYDYCTIVCHLGATDIAMTALKVQTSDASGGTYADLSGATFDGGTDSEGGTLALPSATDDGQICVFQLDLQGVNRYLKVIATFGDGTAGGFMSGEAILTRGQIELTDVAKATGGVCRL